MKKIPFHKYQGTGNDFVMIDNRSNTHLTKDDTEQVRLICDRKFGIGADGLILLQEKEGYDFEMVYFNADGSEGSMCGNGGRCIVAFAKWLEIIDDKCRFLAIDGAHEAMVKEGGWVELKMGDVQNIEKDEDSFILDTGSPHYVIFVEDLDDINVVKSGQVIRYSDRFRQQGINVNFVEKTENGISVATYERGVEDETLSCGTGVTAAAIAWHLQNISNSPTAEVPISTKGGQLKIRLEKKDGAYQEVWLCGPTARVFSGEYYMGSKK